MRAEGPGLDAETRRLSQELSRRVRLAESRPAIPDLDELCGLLLRAAEVQFSLDSSVRPRRSSGAPGSLLNIPAGIPVLILPDLHTRAGLLRRALEWKPPGEERPLVELLLEGRAFLLLLGDLFHSEGADAPRRWEYAWREYLTGYAIHEDMDEEMARALATLDSFARAMILAPVFVGCLKGNHDNSRNREGSGDHSFYKFADEGAMCAAWLEARTRPDFREALAAFEESLPLAARGELFAASHAEPAFALTVLDVVEGAPETAEALTWTANDQALPDAVAETLASLLGPEAAGRGARWISGHRPVRERYALRANGLLVQIHAPFSLQAAWVRPDRPFDPERDVISL